MYIDQHISVVIPAFNEQQSVGMVVRELRQLQYQGQQLVDHIVVCDNASTDATADVANAAGAVVVHEAQRGYGSACLCALAHLPPTDVIVFVDADRSVEVTQLPLLLDRLHQGADLVIGSRSLGVAEAGAMTPQQIWGNRLVTCLMRRVWRKQVTDLGPFRLLRPAVLQQLQMCDPAYGWTVEMQAKALCFGLRVEEVPVDSRVRVGKSKISGTWRGTFGAMIGILSTLASIIWRYHFRYPACRRRH